jgi:2'-5' RNA ligase
VRLFVAIYPPAEALDDVMAQVPRLRIGAAADAGVNVRLAARANLHVTVAFLGEVPDDRSPEVTAALGRAVRTWRRGPTRRRDRPTRHLGSPTVAEPTALRLRLGGGGRFGRGRFTVLWVGVLGDVAALRRLADASRRELRRARLPYDSRPLRPHLTLARPGDRIDRESVDEDLRTLDGYLGPSWSATELVLVRSHLGPRPTYDRLATWPLAEETPEEQIPDR